MTVAPDRGAATGPAPSGPRRGTYRTAAVPQTEGRRRPCGPRTGTSAQGTARGGTMARVARSTFASRSYRDDAVVLRTYKLGEADRIVILLSAEHGQVRAVAKGVRRTTSRFGARLEPFNVAEVQLVHGRTLDIVSQAIGKRSYGERIASDYESYTAAAAMAETAEKLTADDHDTSSQHYRLLVGALSAVARGCTNPGGSSTPTCCGPSPWRGGRRVSWTAPAAVLPGPTGRSPPHSAAPCARSAVPGLGRTERRHVPAAGRSAARSLAHHRRRRSPDGACGGRVRGHLRPVAHGAHRASPGSRGASGNLGRSTGGPRRPLTRTGWAVPGPRVGEYRPSLREDHRVNRFSPRRRTPAGRPRPTSTPPFFPSTWRS